MSFTPVASSLFFSKNDPQDPRLGEYFKPNKLTTATTTENDVAILGFPDDEGIQLNGGRSGSSQTPHLIRQFLYKMSWPYSGQATRRFFDFGDLSSKDTLEKKHAEALEMTTELHRRKLLTVSFGGGHDYGYSDAAGFIKNYLNSNERPLVINFDAHLDVRPTDKGFNSGTPFFRLLNEYSEEIDFVEIGLQPQCNSIYHREWALKKRAFLFDLKETQNEKIMELFEKSPFTRLNLNTPVYVSFDIDCLTSSEGGGCSQSWVTGLRTQPCLDFLAELYRRTNCRGFGIYEVSPPLDVDFRTSKAAALLAYHFIFRS